MRCPLCQHSCHTTYVRKAHVEYVKCAQCGLVWLWPVEVNLDEHVASVLDRRYTSEWIQRRLDSSARLRAEASDHMRTINKYRHGQPGRLLEVGPGTGEVLAVAQEIGYKVLGIDLSQANIDHIRQAYPFVRAECWDFDNVRRSGKVFDVIVMSHVLEHVADPVSFLAAARSLLAEDGFLYLAVPNLGSLHARLTGEHWGNFCVDHTCLFTSDTLAKTLELSGFRPNVILTSSRHCGVGSALTGFLKYRILGLRPDPGLLFQTAAEARERRLQFKHRLSSGLATILSIALAPVVPLLDSRMWGAELICIATTNRELLRTGLE